jgi:hypothetical protein
LYIYIISYFLLFRITGLMGYGHLSEF